MHFASPYYLWLLTLLVPMIGYYVWRTLQGGASIQISSVAGVVRAPRTVRYYLRQGKPQTGSPKPQTAKR